MQRLARIFLGPTAGRRGGVAIVGALSLVGLLGTAGLAVDFGAAYVRRAHLQKVADSAALAGGLSWIKSSHSSDAAIANEMPKSAYAANSQAKLVARAIIAELAGRQPPAPRMTNTCWSLLAPDDDVKLGADYQAADGRLIATGGFTSHPGDSAEVRKQNYLESVGWYAAITAEMFALPAPPAGESRQPG